MCRDCIYDQFDPVAIVNQMMAELLPDFFDAVLDYSGDDAGFIELILIRSSDIIVKVLVEMEEGFIDDINDMLLFCKSNLMDLLMASGSP